MADRDCVLGVGIPAYQPGNVAASALMQAMQSTRLAGFAYNEQVGSILTASFNALWCWALNARKVQPQPMTHFLMLHADIRPMVNPGSNWFTTLLEEMEAIHAEVISQIVPIKDGRGLTSTAFDTNQWAPMRLSLTQAMAFPKTWTCEGLLWNTGMMLVDLRKDWVENIHFEMSDGIRKNEETGEFYPIIEPEDWNFSRKCRRLGVLGAVTRAVELDHHGTNAWSSTRVWGEALDPNNKIEGRFTITDAHGNQTVFAPERENLNQKEAA